MSDAAKSVPRAPALSSRRLTTVYCIGLGIWLSGVSWLLAHYVLMQSGPFGVSPHPLEFWSRVAHGAFGFASLWLLGLLWNVHIPAGWRSLRRRWSGSIMFSLTAFLVITGFLLYYVGNDEILSAVTLLHWSVGLLGPIFFFVHRLSRDSAG